MTLAFKGFEVIVNHRKKNYANEGFIYASCDTTHFWALKDIRNGKIVLKSDLFKNKEEAEEASKEFAERLFIGITEEKE